MCNHDAEARWLYHLKNTQRCWGIQHLINLPSGNGDQNYAGRLLF